MNIADLQKDPLSVVSKYLLPQEFKNLAGICKSIHGTLNKIILETALANLNSIIKQLEKEPNSRYIKQAEKLRGVANTLDSDEGLLVYANFHKKIKAAAEILQTVHKNKLKELEVSPTYFPLKQVAISLHNYNKLKFAERSHIAYPNKKEYQKIIAPLYALQVWGIAFEYDPSDETQKKRHLIKAFCNATEFGKAADIWHKEQNESIKIQLKKEYETLKTQKKWDSFLESFISKKIPRDIDKLKELIFQEDRLKELMFQEDEIKELESPALLYNLLRRKTAICWIEQLISEKKYESFEEDIEKLDIEIPEDRIHEYKIDQLYAKKDFKEVKWYCLEQLDADDDKMLIMRVADRVIKEEGIEECIAWMKRAEGENYQIFKLIKACTISDYVEKIKENENQTEVPTKFKLSFSAINLETVILEKLIASNKYEAARNFLAKYISQIVNRSGWLVTYCDSAIEDYFDAGKYEEARIWINKVISEDSLRQARDCLINYINAVENLEQLPEVTIVNNQGLA